MRIGLDRNQRGSEMSSRPRRRIWAENLPARVLKDPATLRLLQRFDLEPIVAIPPEREDGDTLEALGRLSGAGIRVGLWPLLSDAEGYWPSHANAASFERRVTQVLAFAERGGVAPRTLAVDLEPRLPITRALLDGPRVRILASELARSISPEAEELRLRASHAFSGVRRVLRARSIESLAAIWPVQLLDLRTKTPILGGLLGTPVRTGEWDVLCPMLYSSMIHAVAPRVADRLTRWAYRSIARSRQLGAISVSLGLVGTGKLGDEAVLEHPELLLRDVQSARAAGVQDLALFSLEGVLGDDEPERWLRVFS